MFDKYENQIAPHKELANQILGPLCSDEDGSREIYKDADRFESEEALKRLKILNEKYFG